MTASATVCRRPLASRIDSATSTFAVLRLNLLQPTYSQPITNRNKEQRPSYSSGTDVIHTCPSYATPALAITAAIPTLNFTSWWMADSSDFGLWRSKAPKMGDSLPRTPMNHRTKFDAASFILAGEIRNRTNKQTNCKRYIHTLPIGMCR